MTTESGSADELESIAESAGLRYVHDEMPGMSRRRRGNGFSYIDADGEGVDDRTRAWITELAIPPAWTDVWISADRRSHLLATGRDDQGRKQYLYHERWREIRDEQKFDRLSRFAAGLVDLRKEVAADLRRRSLDERRVVATVIRLLDTTLIRIGNEQYAAEHETFGLTTLSAATSAPTERPDSFASLGRAEPNGASRSTTRLWSGSSMPAVISTSDSCSRSGTRTGGSST